MVEELSHRVEHLTDAPAAPRRRHRGPYVHVRTAPYGGWMVTLNHADEPYSVHRSGQGALRAAKAYVAAHPGAVLRIDARPR